MSAVGLDPGIIQPFPSQVSGGHLQRLSVSRALATRPSLAFIDEPTSALDVSISGQIVNPLGERRTETGPAYLLVAHDLCVVYATASRVAVMHLGEFVGVAARRMLFDRPLHRLPEDPCSPFGSRRPGAPARRFDWPVS